MRFLVITKTQEPFLTHWFDAENNFNNEECMTVFDLQENKYMTDGETWKEINEDHL